MTRDEIEHARPRDVLLYIDAVMDPDRPLVIDIKSTASCRAALPRAEAELRAARVRLHEITRIQAAYRTLVSGMEQLAETSELDFVRGSVAAA